MAGDNEGPHTVLWVDLRTQSAPDPRVSVLAPRCRIEREVRVCAIPDAIRTLAPRLLCFDFDCPDYAGLQALRETKGSYPALPILMFTEQHSEALAVWAFRSGVRDYLVKPVADEELRTRIAMFSNPPDGNGAVSRCNWLSPPHSIRVLRRRPAARTGAHPPGGGLYGGPFS